MHRHVGERENSNFVLFSLVPDLGGGFWAEPVGRMAVGIDK
jgi:hypothetical protein